MTELLVTATAVCIVALLYVATKRVITGDGYGRRISPPTSHRPDAFAVKGHGRTSAC